MHCEKRQWRRHANENTLGRNASIKHVSPCQRYSRRQECGGRPALQEEQSCSHRMDTSPVRGGNDFQHMGQAQCIPIRLRLNNRLPVFVSPMADHLAVDVDAMSITWSGMYACVFPLFVMLGRVIDKTLHDHPCELILIGPKWPNQAWYARLLELLIEFPLVLPLRKDPLS